jgi:YegS/Rv2252/BmrU family lipid kinase
MNGKKACLVINPRDGQNMAKLTGILSVLSAAGWHTDVALKEYPGHTMELGTQAAKQNYDLVISYGGDGTLNQVVNGVMNGKKHKSIVGTIPGGTVNQWAEEVSIPSDPVKAALTLVSSDVRKVDIARVEITSLEFLPTTQESQQQTPIHDFNDQKSSIRKVKSSPNARHNFLLMAGLGIDAAVMEHVNKSLKHRIGVAAVGLTILEKLPEQHAFPVEIWSTENGSESEQLWQGKALQVIIGNTRRYAGSVEMTADAFIDDGVLDVCVIMAGEPLSTMQQVTSILLRRKSDTHASEFFRGSHLSIRVPASIAFQVDGSTVKLKDYLSKSDRKALQHAENAEHVMVTYQFDALPKALKVAIPSNYDDTLFENTKHAESQEESQQTPEEAGSDSDTSQQHSTTSTGEQQPPPEQLASLIKDGRKVTVIAVSPRSIKDQTYIVAGTFIKQSTGEVRPVAIRIKEDTTLLKRTGECIAADQLKQLQENTEIVVEGKKSKRGVIQATRLVI